MYVGTVKNLSIGQADDINIVNNMAGRVGNITIGLLVVKNGDALTQNHKVFISTSNSNVLYSLHNFKFNDTKGHVEFNYNGAHYAHDFHIDTNIIIGDTANFVDT